MIVVVCSCFSYSDLWPTFLNGVQRFWPDREWPIVIISDFLPTLPTNLPSDVSFFSVESNLSWTKILRTYLQSIDNQEVFLLLDDFILKQDVQNSLLIAASSFSSLIIYHVYVFIHHTF